MDEQAQIDQVKLQIGTWGREDWHELRKAVDATAITVAVMQERQKANGELMQRVESVTVETRDMLRTQNGRLSANETKVAVLEARESDARSQGARWGGYTGGFVAALIAGLSAWAGGTK